MIAEGGEDPVEVRRVRLRRAGRDVDPRGPPPGGDLANGWKRDRLHVDELELRDAPVSELPVDPGLPLEGERLRGERSAVAFA
jgi:hypothetical protein